MTPEGEPLPSPEITEASFVRLADAHRCEGLVDDAIRICREGLAQFPSSLRGRIVLGQSLLDRGAIGEAIVELCRVERESHEDPEILALLCQVHLAGPWAWPVGAQVVKGSAGLAATPADEHARDERVETPVLILDADGEPTDDTAVQGLAEDDPLASSTLAGLYASQGDPTMADAILGQIASDQAPPPGKEAPAGEPIPPHYLTELRRLRQIAARLRKAQAR